MAKEAVRNQPKADEAPSEGVGSPAASGTRWNDRITRKRLAMFLSASLAVNLAVLGYAYVRVRGTKGSRPPEPEVSLGEFCYHGERVEGSRVSQADFSLYVALAEPNVSKGWSLLADHKFRIRQGIEELLRRAHAGDFEDPVLKDLKRRFQDRIEETVGERVVADVMVTNLKVRWNSPEVKPRPETAEAVPWTEKPSG